MLSECPCGSPGAATSDPRPPFHAARLPSVYLHPGQMFASRTPTTVTTILGSCVSVCVWDPFSRIGGINHYLLPSGSAEAPLRFGDVATHALVAELLALGAGRSGLKAKVFGGSCIADVFVRRGAGHLGEENVERALEALRADGVPVEARDTGGRRGRKLIFHTDDGSAWVKEL